MSKRTERQLAEALEILGKQIKRLRESLDLTQAEFGALCGWDITRQSRIESGGYNLTVESLIAIANAAKMALDIKFSKL